MFTLALAATKGQVGKTTLAAALCTATQIINPSASVSLIDLDPKGSITGWSDRRTLPNPILLDAAGLSPTAIKGELQDAGTDLLVFDCPPGFSTVSRQAIEVADLVLIPIGPSDLAPSMTSAAAYMARQAHRPYRFVLNQKSLQKRIPGASARQLYGDDPPLLPPVHHRNVIDASMAEGRTALEAEPHGAASRELWALWAAVFKALGAFPAVQPRKSTARDHPS